MNQQQQDVRAAAKGATAAQTHRQGARHTTPQASMPEKTNTETALSGDALDFVPGLLAIQESPPARMPRVVMYLVTALFALLVAWSVFGKLDIVAVAEGRLVPQTRVKIVQPADGGIVQEILVREGEHVQAGQVLMRMDTKDAKADESTLQTQLALRSLQLRRIEAEMNNLPLVRQAGDPADLFRQVESQYRERRQAYLDGLGEAQQAHKKAQREVDSGREVLAKLREVAPILKQQADSYADLGKDGYAPQVQVRDRQREYMEKVRDLHAQEATLASLSAAEAAAAKQVAQLTSRYRSDLQNERIDAEGQYRKVQQDWVKQEHKTGLLALKAPQSGIAKDLATHTVGTVVSPGTVLLTLVPDNEPLVAEVMVKNDDVGFIYPHQKVRLKLAAYPFQQYGMLDGEVTTIGADASEGDSPDVGRDGAGKAHTGTSAVYKAQVALGAQHLQTDGKQYGLVAGMQVMAEVNQGRRTVMEYLLSPLQKAMHESGRER
jgi:hemolysin D